MYELVEGGEILPEATGVLLPAPPQSVRDRTRFPRRFQMDCLHRDRAAEHADTYYQVARRYLKGFPKYAKFGKGPILAGPARSDASKTAAALAHEIIMRYGGNSDMTAGWLSGFWVLRMILDAKSMNRSETYTTLRNQIFNYSVLVVDDLLSAVETDGGRSFIETVYAYRTDHRLPTITTIVTPEPGTDLTALIEKSYGKKFRERLSLSCGSELLAHI